MCLSCRSHRCTRSGRIADVVICYCRNGLLHIRLMVVDLSWWKSANRWLTNSGILLSNSRTTLLQTIFNDVEKYAQHCKNHPWKVKCLGFDINPCKEQKFLQFALNIEHLFSFKWEFVQRKVLLINGNGSFPGHQILNIRKVSCLLNKVIELKAALIVSHNSNSMSNLQNIFNRMILCKEDGRPLILERSTATWLHALAMITTVLFLKWKIKNKTKTENERCIKERSKHPGL